MTIKDGVKYYDSEEVCALLGINYRTLVKYWANGTVNSVKIHNKRYSTEAAIEEYTNRILVKAGAEKKVNK